MRIILITIDRVSLESIGDTPLAKPCWIISFATLIIPVFAVAQSSVGYRSGARGVEKLDLLLKSAVSDRQFKVLREFT
jgi:hypothetical protein